MDLSESLVKSAQKLINRLKLAVRNPNPNHTIKEHWEQPENWDDAIKNLESLISISRKEDKFFLAKALISIGKNLDYYYIGWAHKNYQHKIEKLIKNIVFISSKILTSYSHTHKNLTCGKHENGACEFGAPSLKQLTSVNSNGLVLPFHHAINFQPTPNRTHFSQISLIRVIGIKNNPYGSYWFMYPLSSSIKEWRLSFAVLQSWNKGTHYVQLNFSDFAWEGYAASQIVPSQNCILNGGGYQVWVPPNIIKKLRKHNKISRPQKTGW